MSRTARALRLIVVAGLVWAAACSGRSKSQGDGGGGGGASGSSGGASGSSGGASGSSGGASGSGGGASGSSGGASGSSGGASGSGGGASGSGGGASGSGGAGGAPITSCPAQASSQTPCTGTFGCEYEFARTCHGRCYSTYVCINGILMFTGANDGCLQLPCPDGGAGSGGSSGGGSDGAGGRGGAGGTDADASTASVCTFGADHTCNDDPRISSIRGRCTDTGACVCADAGTNPDSGRCL